jgi:hypothetical protein
MFHIQVISNLIVQAKKADINSLDLYSGGATNIDPDISKDEHIGWTDNYQKARAGP